jgi:hypothetical protein
MQSLISQSSKYPKLILLSLLIFIGCKKPNESQPTDKVDWNAISDKLIERMALQPNEKVFMIGQPGKFDTLVTLLTQKIKINKGNFLGTISIDSIQPIAWETEFTRSASQLDSVALVDFLSETDLGIMLPGAAAFHKPYAAMQQVLKKGKARTIHFHWIGAYDKNGKSIEVTDSIALFYQKALLTTDYNALTKLQQKFEANAQGKWIQVRTPEGTDLRFQITGRPVTKQDGNASLEYSRKAITLIDREVELPAGAIRVAPLEETVEGTIAFPPSIWSGKEVKGLVVHFVKGKIVSLTATEGEDAVKKELEMGGDAAHSFRELAIGFNKSLVPTSGHTWIPYFGYGAGIVRLSLGDNSELNGNVRGNYVRWNFFTNATVIVGDEEWINNGKLLIVE